MPFGSRVIVTLLAALLCLGGCQGTHPYETTLISFLEARASGDLDRAESYLAPEARIWFDEKTGEGSPKTVRGGWGAWDIEMNAVNTFTDVEVDADERRLTARFHEENDYSRLLGFDGWDSVSTYWFDEEGLIAEQLYVPIEPERPRDEALAPFLEWARRTHPVEIEAIHPIEPSAEMARRWRTLLVQWRTATDVGP